VSRTNSLRPATLPQDLSLWGMFLNAVLTVKIVMVGLAIASLATWAVMLLENYRTVGRESISATWSRNTCPCNQPAWGGKGIRTSEIPRGPPSRRRSRRSRPF
jgi:hypothetical protein